MTAIATSIVAHPRVSVAQDEPLYESLRQAFKRDYPRFGTLLQTVADFQIERSFSGNDGFSVASFRLMLSGELDQGFGYLLATNFVGSPSILDAMMYYRISSHMRLNSANSRHRSVANFSRMLGASISSTAVTEFQVNYVIDTDSAAPENHQVLINFQFGF